MQNMNFFEGVSQVLALANQAIPLAQRLLATFKRQPRFSYENLSVAIVVDLQDKAGRRAVVTCSQRVRFLVSEAGVVTSHVWGEGQRVRRLSLDGARSFGRRAEGSKDLLLLGLNRRPGALSVVSLKAHRLITGGFLKKDEYFEVSVERPTKLLSLRILFPKNRTPRDAYINADRATRDATRSVSFTPQGRPQLRWQQRVPEVNRVYRLGWSW